MRRPPTYHETPYRPHTLTSKNDFLPKQIGVPGNEVADARRRPADNLLDIMREPVVAIGGM